MKLNIACELGSNYYNDKEIIPLIQMQISWERTLSRFYDAVVGIVGFGECSSMGCVAAPYGIEECIRLTLNLVQLVLSFYVYHKFDIILILEET